MRAAPLGAIFALTALGVDALEQTDPVPERETLPAGREAFSQWSAVTDRYQATIEQEESQSGPHSRALIDPLISLGLAHQEYGRHDLAVDTIERALQVKRVNDGLYNLDQVPMIRQLIISELGQSDFGQAAALEARLVELARLNHDDLRSVAIFQGAADRQLATYQRYLKQGFPPQIGFSSNTSGSAWLSGSSGGRSSFGLRQARRNYSDAIRGLLRKGLQSHEDLPGLEKKLLLTYYLELTRRNSWPDRTGMLYSLGRQSYKRQVAYSAASSGTAVDFANALVELADWDVLFSRNGKALEQYKDAYRLLVADGVADTSIRKIFTPDTPVRLPTFMPNPLAAPNDADDSTAYIDVAFELGKYGTARKIEIVDASDSDMHASERRLVRLIAASRFRPRLSDGESGSTDRYYLRYYVGR